MENPGMASPPVAERVLARPGISQAWRLFLLPLALGVVAVIVAGVLDHVWAGLLFTGGLLLGAVNGFAAQVAAVRVANDATADRSAVVRGSLWRLAAITIVALAIAFLARPTGWVLLLGLAVYQLISTFATLGATMRELRNG
jgi:hypothetical protein